ncbi:hypothetical protein Tco_1103917 [Tanacetum coccineum]
MIWEIVHNFQLGVESYQQQVNLTAQTITFLGIKKYKVFSIIFEPIYVIIYKNNKKEKRVRRHQEVPKFCDATLKRVLEGLKSYNNDVKYGYVTHNLSKEDVEYLQLFAERLKNGEDELRLRLIGSPGKKNCNYKEFMSSSSLDASTSQSFSSGPSTHPSSSLGPSEYAPSLGKAECSNCKLLDLKVKILEVTLDMKRHPDDHTCQLEYFLSFLMT